MYIVKCLAKRLTYAVLLFTCRVTKLELFALIKLFAIFFSLIKFSYLCTVFVDTRPVSVLTETQLYLSLL